MVNAYQHLCQYYVSKLLPKVNFQCDYPFLGLVCVFLTLPFLAFLLSMAARALAAFVCFKAPSSHMVPFFCSYPVQ